jgi:hypothetical protein
LYENWKEDHYAPLFREEVTKDAQK